MEEAVNMVLAVEPNDRRGWILASVSGIACVLGSCIICLDLVTRLIPRFRKFNIRKNKTFLSASLSLSFGVMVFSALYGILPEASSYLKRGGKSPTAAKFMSIGFFMVGVIGLSLISEVLHRLLPSSIVHCEHTDGSEHIRPIESSEEESSDSEGGHDHGHCHTHVHTHVFDRHHQIADLTQHHFDDHHADPHSQAPPTENTPLMSSTPPPQARKPVTARISESVSSLVVGKGHCASGGTCYGYSEIRPCDRMCLPHIKASRSRSPVAESEDVHPVEVVPELDGDTLDLERGQDNQLSVSQLDGAHHTYSIHSHDHAGHHHVPMNEYLSIGLQTSLAIALHKIPEGFITFATNHANPKLGFAVFLALFIHNITEGFAMSLPLFLALRSRLLAILWASVLGGLSQPAGALCAALFLRGRQSDAPSEVVYGVIFALTAGIMSNVAVQLYGQAVSIYHNQRIPLLFAFLGMGILGVSFAINEE